MERYVHVIWDWNGTILEDVEMCVSVINGILAGKKLPQLSVDEYRDIFTIPVIDYYNKLNFDFEEESFESIGRRFIDTYEKRKYECGLYKGSIDILGLLFRNGVKQSVLSGYYQDTLNQIIEHFDLTKYFEHLVGMDNIYAGSKVANGKSLLNKLNHVNGKILLIGDTAHDYDVAKEIGAECVLLENGHQSAKQLANSGALIVKDQKELFKYFSENI